jgi:hypothetical protein
MAVVNCPRSRVRFQVPGERQAASLHGLGPGAEIRGDAFGWVTGRFQGGSRGLAHVAEHPVDD